MRHVRGTLFVDYVRMIRSRKDIDWSRYLEPQDFVYLREKVDDDAWYPTTTFERMGVGIMVAVADCSVEMVRSWGRFQVDGMLRTDPNILAEGNPRDTLMRVVVQRQGFFDFEVLTVREILDDQALFELSYQMRDVAELAACSQTLGAFEELVRRAGGQDVSVEFVERRWEGHPRTSFEVRWR